MFSLEMDDNSDVKGSCVNPNPEIYNRIFDLPTTRKEIRQVQKISDCAIRLRFDPIRSDCGIFLFCQRLLTHHSNKQRLT